MIAVSKLIIYMAKAVLIRNKNRIVRHLDSQGFSVYTEKWRSQNQ
ncbi:hypothetical protein [Nostoc sp. CHAB 5836]|nr:hypothetical protein [Nostoc sp. CHAB 5836]